jgi:hypothetical protein
VSSQTFDIKKRNILPRWNRFSTACLIGDILPARNHEDVPIGEDEILEKSRKWILSKHPSDALDLIGICMVLNAWDNVVAIEAAKYVTDHPTDFSSVAKEMAGLYISDPDTRSREKIEAIIIPPDTYGEISRLRRHVRAFPRDAIMWADLAYSYAVIGQEKKARKAMRTAYALSPFNRFVVRSAARCFAHFGNPDEALWCVQNSPLRNTDPMVISTEIALSRLIDRSPRNIKTARSAISSGLFSNRSMSELHVALATVESIDGSIRAAKKHVEKSLLDPNENVLAQIQSLNARVSGILEKMEIPNNITATYEADSHRSYKAENFEEAYRYALLWFQYQPFSARPAVQASFIASLFFDDQEAAIQIITRAKKAEPINFLLNNNYACSLALLNRTIEAADALAEIDPAELDEQKKRVYAATSGLVAYRKGDTVLGEEKYREAIEGFKKDMNYRGIAIAAYYQAREIDRISGGSQPSAVDEVLTFAKKYNISDLAHAIERKKQQNKID